MDRQIRRLGVALMICFIALFAQLSYIQVFRAKGLNNRPGNSRPIDAAFSRERGTISSADGAVLARSIPTNDRYKFQRVYPEKDLFGQITGYFNYSFGASGLELQYNSELAGRTAKQQIRSLGDLFVEKNRTGNLELTIRKDVQQVARDALGARKGSVVAIDVKTGGILALWSYPTFDPNVLSQHPKPGNDPSTAAKELLDADPAKPLLAKSYRDTFFPGSTFKIVTASAGLASGKVTPDTPSFPVVTSYTPPGTTRPLRNFGGEACGGALFTILAKSCNSSFANMGVDIGVDGMIHTAESYGFNQAPPIDMPAPVASKFPQSFIDPGNGKDDLAALAQSSIGQRDVQASPLQMAMVAAAVANKGQMMVPHLVREIRDGEGALVSKPDAKVWKTVVTPQVAQTMHDAMLGVVQNGSASALAVPGFETGGKTGTAQLGTNPPQSHTWIIGFAGPPGDPQVAVAVIVERQPGVSEATGGRVAAPIGKAVLEQALKPITATSADGN